MNGQIQRLLGVGFLALGFGLLAWGFSSSSDALAEAVGRGFSAFLDSSLGFLLLAPLVLVGGVVSLAQSGREAGEAAPAAALLVGASGLLGQKLAEERP